MKGDQYAYDADTGTTWPIPWRHDDTDGVEWRLRYSEQRDVFAASCVAAYAALIDPHITMAEAIKKLRTARRAIVMFSTDAAIGRLDEATDPSPIAASEKAD